MKIKSLLVFTVLAIIMFQLSSCNSLENLTNSSAKLILWNIQGEDASGESTSIVLSDVVIGGSVFNDNATAQLTSVLLDPLNTATDGATYYQDVIIDQVDIEYSRADGFNVQGKDVPYTFSQKVSQLVETNSTTPTELPFILVSHNAKSESPLVELTNLGQEHILKLEAKITFYAKDLAGNRLAPVSGTLSIWCANFGDSESSGSQGGGTGGGN